MTDGIEASIQELMKPVVARLEAQASHCATAPDLQQVIMNATWLNAIANRLLGSAVLSYANNGTIPGPPAGSHAKRASLLLEMEGLPDPDLEKALLQTIRLQRSAQDSCVSLQNAVHALVNGELGNPLAR
ncbi:hypothetical protein [Streptomyces hydrogenans]|uniref:hypothetical protein n=2 Tax=Streptomyces hydrogenans TaxID=1873719 RepID=UPI0035DF6A7D